MDCSRTSLSNSGPLEFSDTNRHMGSSTMETKSKTSDTDRLMENSTVELKKSKSLKDGSNKENKVRKKTTYSQAQLQELHTYFNQNAYLNTAQMVHLSRKLGLTQSQVKKWFQNMRMKRKKQSVSAQEFQMHDPSVMNLSTTPGIAQPDVAQTAITLQKVSWTNITHAVKMDNQSCKYFFHLHKEQKTAEFPNAYYNQAIAVPTYSNPYLGPHNFQSNYVVEQSWNTFSRDNLQQQQSRENYQADLVNDQPEAN